MNEGCTDSKHSICLVSTKEDAMVVDCIMLFSMEQEL